MHCCDKSSYPFTFRLPIPVLAWPFNYVIIHELYDIIKIYIDAERHAVQWAETEDKRRLALMELQS